LKLASIAVQIPPTGLQSFWEKSSLHQYEIEQVLYLLEHYTHVCVCAKRISYPISNPYNSGFSKFMKIGKFHCETFAFFRIRRKFPRGFATPVYTIHTFYKPNKNINYFQLFSLYPLKIYFQHNNNNEVHVYAW
jgi:hypothetical protein